MTALPLDMKVDKGPACEKETTEKMEAEYQQGAAASGRVLTAPHGQSSPHLLASPQPYDRNSDSPQVSSHTFYL